VTENSIMGNRHGIGRSALVVCFVVLAVVSVSVAGIDTASATEPIDLETDEDLVYYGQEVRIDANDLFDVDEDDEVYVYELEDGEIDSVVDRPVVDADGTIVFDTEEADDDDGPQFALTDESGLDGAVYELTMDTQAFDADWSRETVASGDETVDIELDTNRRAEYNVTISADDLEYEDLEALFVTNDTDIEEVTDPAYLPLAEKGYDREDGDGLEDLRSDGYITLDLADSTSFSDDDEIRANLRNLEETVGLPDEDDYEFDLLVTDTAETSSTTLEIGETAASFEEDRYAHAAGDLVEFTIDLEATDEAWVQLGDEDVGFVDVLYVEDDDDSGDVTVTMNTRLAGTDHSNLDGVDAEETDIVYHSEDDIVESYLHDDVIAGQETTVGEAAFYDDDDIEGSTPISLEEYLVELDILDDGQHPTEQLDRPLQPGSYALSVEGGQNFVAGEGADNEIGSAEVGLLEPRIDGAESWSAPAGEADDEDSIDGLTDEFTESESIATSDRFATTFNVSGLSGSLATIDYVENDRDITDGVTDGFSASVLDQLSTSDSEWAGDGITFDIEGTGGANQDPNTLTLEDLSTTEGYVLASSPDLETDGIDETVAIVLDTDSEPFERDLDDGDSVDVELGYETGDDRYQFAEPGSVFGGEDGDSSTPVHPALPPGVEFNASTAPTFETPAVTFDRTDDGVVRLPADGELNVSGETNLAPETDLSVTLRDNPDDENPDTDTPFLNTTTETVDEDTSFNAVFDIDQQSSGTEAVLSVDANGETIEQTDAVFEEIDDEPPHFVPSLETTNTTEPGETLEVNATVENTGDEPGTADVRTIVGTEVLFDDSIDLEAGESESTIDTLEVTNETIGGANETDLGVALSTQHDATTSVLTVGDDSETLEPATQSGFDAVDNSTSTDATMNSSDDTDGSASSAETERSDSGDDGISGFETLTALIAVLAAVVFLGRRVR